METGATEHLSKINSILAKIKVPIALISLKECVPSLWIAVFEGLLETRIPDIDRSLNNLTDESRTRNLEAVIGQLQNLFKIDLSHIHPAELIACHEPTICEMIDVFAEIAKSNDDYQKFVNISDESIIGPEDDQKDEKRTRRSIYTGKKPLSLVKDDIGSFIKGSSSRSLHWKDSEEILQTPIKEKAEELLKPGLTDTPHMKALKLKRFHLLKNISTSLKKKPRIESKEKEESEKDKRVEKQIKEILSRPKNGPLSEEQQPVKKVLKTKAERNLEIYQNRIRKIPIQEPYPSKQAQELVQDQQIKTWKKALDDRLWNRKIKNHSNMQTIVDSKILEQAEKEIKKSVEIETKKKEEKALKNIKSDLNERVRRVIRMEHRRQVVQEEVENYKSKRRFKEEQTVKGLLDDYVKAERKMIIEERRYEKDMKKAADEKIKIEQESQLNYYRDQIDLLKEKYEETKKADELAEKAMKEEKRKLIREKKEAAKKKIGLIKEKLGVDASYLGFQEANAERIRSSLKFAFR